MMKFLRFLVVFFLALLIAWVFPNIQIILHPLDTGQFVYERTLYDEDNITNFKSFWFSKNLSSNYDIELDFVPEINGKTMIIFELFEDSYHGGGWETTYASFNPDSTISLVVTKNNVIEKRITTLKSFKLEKMRLKFVNIHNNILNMQIHHNGKVQETRFAHFPEVSQEIEFLNLHYDTFWIGHSNPTVSMQGQVHNLTYYEIR
jgi:hypothetical protein